MSGDLVFYGFAALTVLSGFVVVLARNVVHAGFALMFALIGVAGLFALLGADFMAVTQTVVYIGGILILVLFAVMMTRIPRLDRAPRNLGRMVPATVFTLGLFALLTKVITGTVWPTSPPGEALPTVKLIGVELLTNYIFPFEFASLVLLVAMIGAAILIRERRVEEEPAPEAPVADEPVADDPTEEVSA